MIYLCLFNVYIWCISVCIYIYICILMLLDFALCSIHLHFLFGDERSKVISACWRQRRRRHHHHCGEMLAVEYTPWNSRPASRPIQSGSSCSTLMWDSAGGSSSSSSSLSSSWSRLLNSGQSHSSSAGPSSSSSSSSSAKAPEAAWYVSTAGGGGVRRRFIQSSLRWIQMYQRPFILAANFTPGQGRQMKTSLLANSGIVTVLFINMHCPWQINWINKSKENVMRYYCHLSIQSRTLCLWILRWEHYCPPLSKTTSSPPWFDKRVLCHLFNLQY